MTYTAERMRMSRATKEAGTQLLAMRARFMPLAVAGGESVVVN